jgi:hypothetical protein
MTITQPGLQALRTTRVGGALCMRFAIGGDRSGIRPAAGDSR